MQYDDVICNASMGNMCNGMGVNDFIMVGHTVRGDAVDVDVDADNF